jgi:hypothetical protein
MTEPTTTNPNTSTDVTRATDTARAVQEQRVDAAKQQIAREREVADLSRADAIDRMSARPTPTQEENDLAKHGAPVMQKQDDGSGPEMHMRRAAPLTNRQIEAGGPTGATQTPVPAYQTRQMDAKQAVAGARPPATSAAATEAAAAEASAAEETTANAGTTASRRGSTSSKP